MKKNTELQSPQKRSNTKQKTIEKEERREEVWR
jgi:hypothetical protein